MRKILLIGLVLVSLGIMVGCNSNSIQEQEKIEKLDSEEVSEENKKDIVTDLLYNLGRNEEKDYKTIEAMDRDGALMKVPDIIFPYFEELYKGLEPLEAYKAWVFDNPFMFTKGKSTNAYSTYISHVELRYFQKIGAVEEFDNTEFYDFLKEHNIKVEKYLK